MDNANVYFDAMLAIRSLRLTDEEALEGMTLVSVETVSDLANESGIVVFVAEHPELFLFYLSKLPWKQQDMLICYYCLSIPQSLLGQIFGTTQTVASFQLRSGVRALCAIIRFGGDPTVKQMRPLFVASGVENAEFGEKIISLTDLVNQYINLRSFRAISQQHKIRRPAIRRAMKNAAEIMEKSPDRDCRMLGAYLNQLIAKMSPTHVGYRTAERDKLSDMVLRDSSMLGAPTIDVRSNHFKQWFSPLAAV